MFAKLADTVQKHSKAIIVLWIVVLLCSLPFALKSSDVLEYDMASMSGSDSEASDGQAIIDQYFDNALDLSEVLVISYSTADELTSAGTLVTKFTELMTEKYGEKITITNGGSYSKTDKNTSGVLLIAIQNNDENFDLSHETGNIRGVVSQAQSAAGTSLTALITGNDAITYDTENSSMEDVKKVDPLSILLIFVLLALFFYAVVTAFVPPAVVGMAYGITLTLIWALGQFLGIYYITSTLLLVVMLGAGCDYSIFIITRYRNERKAGATHEHALREAVMWGGESVATSGISVMIGFAALALCSFEMVQTMGLALALGILVALLAALTFIPSLINLLGEKIFWPSNIDKYVETDRSFETPGKGKGGRHFLAAIGRNYFAWLARITRKYAKVFVAVFIILCIPATYYYTTTDDSYDMISVMPDSESVDGLDLIMTQTSGGTIMPTYVVLELDQSVIGGIGSLTVGDTTIPYLSWTETAQTTIVPAIMQLSQTIKTKYSDIVDSASGLNMYSLIYQQTSAALAQKGLPTDTATVNQYVVEHVLPSAVTGYVETVFTQAATIAGLPESQKYAIDTSAEILPTFAPGYTLSMTIDYILNIGTGILSNSHGYYVNMSIVTSERPMSQNTMDFVVDIANDFHKTGGYDESLSFLKNSYVAGTSAKIYDIGEIVEDQFSIIKIVVVVLLILLLFFILGCYVTPIRALITIVMSVIWTVALTHFVFEDLLNTPVLFLIPIVLFVVLLGLGMDYEIFLTTKIRENKIKGMDNSTAIEEAVKSSGGVISLCALLMGGTFLTLLLAGSSMLQELGFALGVGILIDGLFMVGFVTPSLMHLLGEWSWKGPKFLQKKFQNADETSEETGKTLNTEE